MPFRSSSQLLGEVTATVRGLAGRLGWRRRPRAPAVPVPTTPCAAASPRFEQARPPFVAEPVDLAAEIPALLTGAVALASPHGCRLEHAVPPGLTVRTDPRVLREALSGILAHAIRQAAGRVLVGARRIAGPVQITICDDGPGADRALQQCRLQSPERLLALQGGSVAIEPRRGQGTVIVVRVPDAPAPSPSTVLHAAAPGDVHGGEAEPPRE